MLTKSESYLPETGIKILKTKETQKPRQLRSEQLKTRLLFAIIHEAKMRLLKVPVRSSKL